MIFKTFDSKIDKWTSKIGIFGKSFNNLGKSINEFGTAVNNAFESVINNIDNFDENVGFWESLKINLFSKKDNNKDWIKNSLGEIISKENIDCYIAELDLDSAKEKLTDIFDWEDLVKNGDATWSEYFETFKDGRKTIDTITIGTIRWHDDISTNLTAETILRIFQKQNAAIHDEQQPKLEEILAGGDKFYMN